MRSRIGTLTAGGKTGDIYESIIDQMEQPSRPYEMVKTFWGLYERQAPSRNNINGKMFEYIVCECLLAFGVSPIYFQSQFYGLEHDTYDLASWTEKGYPIIVSCKTSLRERWKQAELEGRLLKMKFPGARSYLITLHPGEAKRLKRGIGEGAVTGIDKVYLADTPEFDDFVKVMRSSGLKAVEPILALRGTPLGA